MSGGTKFDAEKPDLSLLPYEALEEISKALMFGAKRYGRNNWKKKIEYTRLISAAMRHIGKFNSGQDLDDESNLNHLSHACCNLIFIISYMKNNIKDNDDRYKG